MKIEIENAIKESAHHTLETFDQISLRVNQELKKGTSNPSNVFATEQTFTGFGANAQLTRIQEENIRALQLLANEPAICRVVALNEEGEKKVFYICRGTPVSIPGYDASFAGYRSPMGSIASFETGDEFKLSIKGVVKSFEVLERVRLRPEKLDSGWDSHNNRFEHVDHGIFNVDSFKNLFRETNIDEIENLLNSLLADDGNNSITVGLRRDVLSKMGLRDQPILDKFQDAIFREHLCSQLLITGPPGTGKTTTLIRRLGQKLDIGFLDNDEKDVIDSLDKENEQNHKTSWLMFTPTELLKQYVKEAFAKEDIPAPDQRLKTWEEYRRHLARNVFGILKTATPGGTFIIKDSLSILKNETITNSEFWFDDFYNYLSDALYERLLNGLHSLLLIENELTKKIIQDISRDVDDSKNKPLLNVYSKLFTIEKEILTIIKQISEEIDKVITRNTIINLTSHKGFFADFAICLDSINSDDSLDEDDEDALFDDDEILEKDGITTPKEAIQKYGRFLKAYSRARVQKRTISEKSKNGKILQWLGKRLPSDIDIELIGRNALIQNSLRRFVNPSRGYLKDVAKVYRKFRKEKIQENKWYTGKPEKPNHVSPFEVDLLILATLKNARELMNQGFVKNNFDDARFEFVKSIFKEFKNQILVDEATDFSALQLSSMLNLTHPKTLSFFACGDFNQRITSWGCHSEDQLSWISKKIKTHPINISYRQSKRLNDFSNQLLKTVLMRPEVIELPSHIDCEGVSPVLLKNTGNGINLCEWLKDRIIEIEQSLNKLPSIAVLVNSESRVQTLATDLNEALSDKNIQSVACPEGKVMGNDNDVRVFDIKHIKGLEFEAVFFIDIDELAENKPGLFDKYLYVGATRAATYLGITCKGPLPEKLVSLEHKFAASFA